MSVSQVWSVRTSAPLSPIRSPRVKTEAAALAWTIPFGGVGATSPAPPEVADADAGTISPAHSSTHVAQRRAIHKPPSAPVRRVRCRAPGLHMFGLKNLPETCKQMTPRERYCKTPVPTELADGLALMSRFSRITAR